MECPDENTLIDLIEGSISEAQRAAIEAHTAHCESCRRVLSRLVEPPTSPRHNTDSAPTVPRDASALRSPELGLRYDLTTVIGRGGMGEVRLARDRRIGREVAVKLLRGDSGDDQLLARFFREAHIQGLLDHPSIVPIHDIGVDPHGNPFFVMKRVSGTTLADVLRDPDAAGGWSRAQLLDRFVDVCHAIDFAHSRGVIHRDLKPANIMLGSFGETYVLDWGVARIVEGRRSALDVTAPLVDEGETQLGAVLGTPGYMSPEQARGELVGPETDVYALGCVVFEILTRKPALARGPAALVQTLAVQHHRPSDHAPDVPPELDELCVRATVQDPAGRITARELANRIQAHLAGDRDLALRRELADDHARRASEAASTDDGRAIAMREAGRALALDPSNPSAQRLLGALLLTTPRTIPAEAIASADVERGRTRQRVLKIAGRGYLGLIVAIAVLALLPVRERWLLAMTAGLALATGIVALVMARRILPMRSRWFVLLLALNCGLIGMSGVLFTPLLIMPIFLIGSLTGWLQQPTHYSPWIVIGAHAVALVAVLGLEWNGVLPSTFEIEHGSLVVTPWVVDLTPAVTAIIFLVTFGSQMLTTGFVMLQNRFSQEAAQNRQHAQSWHLRQLLPRVDAKSAEVA